MTRVGTRPQRKARYRRRARDFQRARESLEVRTPVWNAERFREASLCGVEESDNFVAQSVVVRG